MRSQQLGREGNRPPFRAGAGPSEIDDDASIVRVLHGHADDRPGLEVDRMLGLVRQMGPAVLHLVIFA